MSLKPILQVALMLWAHLSFSQDHMMKVNDTLKMKGDFMVVKRNSVGAAGKYEFGPYRIVSAKKGGETTKTRSKFLSNVSESESKQTSSFIFTASDKDSTIVNLYSTTASKAKKTHSISFQNGKLKREEDEPELQSAAKNLTAIISFTTDTTTWKLGYITKYDADSSNLHGMHLLTDGKNEIEIREILGSDNGKTSMLWEFHGYEFTWNGKTLMAVQTFTKQYVWMDKELDDKMKLVLASAAAALLFNEF